MARGWDRGGALGVYDDSTWRLICGLPPGPGVGPGVGGGALRPNAFLGQCVWDLSPPAINIGVSDFAIEFWYAFKTEFNTTSDFFWFVGFCDQRTVLPTQLEGMGAARCDNTVWALTGRYDDVVDAGAAVIATGASANRPGGWNYCAVNFNRAGNMDLIINGVVEASAAINANNMGAKRFYPFVGAENVTARYNGDWDDWTSFNQARIAVGPVAMHMRLLTQAELNSSLFGKRVQNFGTPNTRICYDWRQIEMVDGTEVEWEFDQTRVTEAHRAGVDGMGIAAPIGAPNTVRVPDLSGSGNDWLLPTFAAYGLTDATRARVAFMSAPFWVT